jgi:hypothetical protein
MAARTVVLVRNITSTWLRLARLSRASDNMTIDVPEEDMYRLVNHLQALDRVFIAAESFVACVGNAVESAPWSDAEEEGFAYLRDAVREVAS